MTRLLLEHLNDRVVPLSTRRCIQWLNKLSDASNMLEGAFSNPTMSNALKLASNTFSKNFRHSSSHDDCLEIRKVLRVFIYLLTLFLLHDLFGVIGLRKSKYIGYQISNKISIAMGFLFIYFLLCICSIYHMC